MVLIWIRIRLLDLLLIRLLSLAILLSLSFLSESAFTTDAAHGEQVRTKPEEDESTTTANDTTYHGPILSIYICLAGLRSPQVSCSPVHCLLQKRVSGMAATTRHKAPVFNVQNRLGCGARDLVLHPARPSPISLRTGGGARVQRNSH